MPDPQIFRPVAIPTTPTVGWVIGLYLAHGVHSSSLRSLQERRDLIARFTKEFSAQPIAECRPGDLLLWLDDNPGWKSAWTRKRVLATIQAIFNWAARLGFLPRNPFAGLSLEQGEPGRAMEPTEFQSLLRGTRGAEFRRVLIYLRFTGCRPSEMSGLERTFVDLQRAVATLTKHKSSHTRRDRKPRVVVLHPVVLKLLAWIYRKQPGGRFVFVNARGDPWTRYSLACRFKRLRKRLGLPVTCKLYGLRHKFGTDAILNGVSLTMLAELMGHSRTETTLHYVHLQSEDLRGAIVQAVKRP